MVAVINTGNSISRTLNYNEQKVQQKKAKCLGAFNYPKDVNHLNFHEKLNMVKHQAELNENVKRNSVHISLNFDPSDRLDEGKLLIIAERYMKVIGFEQQPYLVYQHNDAGHPHIHIVSIKVNRDGSRIDMQNMGRNQSRKACEVLENEFKLTKAKGRKQQISTAINPSPKVVYGKSETKRAIANVLERVLPNYLYTSLPELNAILKEFNVRAEKGNTTSRIYKNNGMIYHALNDSGKPTGIPIKASLFYNNPGLKFLESRFKENESKRIPHKARLKNIVDVALLQQKHLTLQNFIEALKKTGIQVVLRQNDQGIHYGITYIDHMTKAVFNGSDLGKQYSIKAILKRAEAAEKIIVDSQGKICINKQLKAENIHSLYFSLILSPNNHYRPVPIDIFSKLAAGVIQPEFTPNYIAYGFRNNTRKKKRKQSRNL